jgi:hypothetical protein
MGGDGPKDCRGSRPASKAAGLKILEFGTWISDLFTIHIPQSKIQNFCVGIAHNIKKTLGNKENF